MVAPIAAAVKEVSTKSEESLSSTKAMFLANYGETIERHDDSARFKIAVKVANEYAHVKDLPPPTAGRTVATGAHKSSSSIDIENLDEDAIIARNLAAGSSAGTTIVDSSDIDSLVDSIALQKQEHKESGALIEYKKLSHIPEKFRASNQLILRQQKRQMAKPEWHAPWNLSRVISGHQGWVRCVAFDPANEWFCTGAADRTIKIWDLASGALKLTLTGHISTVRALKISTRHPYMFSVGEDKTVKCWDLETNKVIRNYHGHLSAVYAAELHPTIDVLVTGGRDSTARVWDIRTKAQVRVLAGHKHTVGAVQCQTADPQVITGSHDTTLRCWDLATGKVISTLTNHKKAIRAVRVHPSEYTFASAAADTLKVWKCPDGVFMRNIEGHNAIVNCMALNRENVLCTGGDNGGIKFWDWKSGYNFQTAPTIVQPGSMEAEAGVFALEYDQTGSRLISCEADKTIKIYKEDVNATEETHPIDFKPTAKRARY